MLQIIEGLVYVVRFFLEMVTIFSLIIGGLMVGNRFEKIVFPLLGILIIIAWGLFVAPKAAYPQGTLVKFIVEILVFSIGTYGIYHLFDVNWALLYGFIAAIDLALVYLFLYINR